MSNGPAGMTTTERKRSQNFGSNVQIGGGGIGPAGMGGGSFQSDDDPKLMVIKHLKQEIFLALTLIQNLKIKKKRKKKRKKKKKKKIYLLKYFKVF